MGRIYNVKENPFRDYLFYSIKYGANISDENYFPDIISAFTFILENILENPKDAVHLDFKVTQPKEGHFKLVALNLISALWLCGIFPRSTQQVIADNMFELDNVLYKFDKRSKKLKYVLIDE